MTRSAMRDRRCIPATRLTTASTNATPTPTHIETTISSSVGVLSGLVFAKSTAAATERTSTTPSERRPGEPSASRIVRASAGSAGV